MKTSIATVSFSGTLDEKLHAIADAGFDAVEIFENDLLSFDGPPRDVGQLVPRSRPRASSPSSRSAISRACRTACASAPSTAPSASSTLMAELGTDLLLSAPTSRRTRWAA